MRFGSVALACFCLASGAAAEPDSAPAAPAPAASPPPRVALALSGGGARGIAHIGALRALEEAGIPVDAIAANSMGAVVGSIYATGRSADDLEQVVRSLDWASLFSGRSDRRLQPVARRVDRHAAAVGVSFGWKKPRLPGGLLADHRINRFLIESLAPAAFAAGRDFDRLPIRFRAIAGDLATGDPVVMARGDLARAVRASLSIPLFFAPVDWEGRKLVDGLIVDNLPIDVARSFEAQVVIAVDIGSPPLDPEDYESALGVANQVSDLLTRRRHLDFSAEADVLIRPDLGDHSATDYSGFDTLIAKGYEAARASVPAIREKLAAAGVVDLARRSPPCDGPQLEGARIAAVRVEGNQRVSQRLARRVFNIPVGPGYIMERGLRAFDKVDASELFERAWMAFEPAADGVEVELRVTEAAPNRVEAGFGYSEWARAHGSLRLLNQNTLGFGEQVELLFAASDAESLVQGELRGERLFVTGLGYRATVQALADKPRFFTEEGEIINRARFDRDDVELALHASVERWGLVEAGTRFGRVTTEPQPGLELAEATDQVGALFGRVVVDTLDDLEWPEHGWRLAVGGDWSLSGLGGEREFWRVQAAGRLARTFRERTTAQLDAVIGLSGRDLAVYDWYRLGGVTLLPGYRHEELKQRQALAGAVSLRYRVLGELRLVARAGAGNVFETTSDIGLDGLRWGVGAGFCYPSPLGPISLEIGLRDGGKTLTTLTVGWN